MTPPLGWRLGVAGGVALVVLLVDQLTKLAVRAVGDALHVTVIPGVIDFLFVRNIGAAFSMGEGHGIAFAVLALAVIVAIAVYLVHPSSPILRLWAWRWLWAVLSATLSIVWSLAS